jgi:dTDP-D-glucose 4,6-dehydratase
MRGLGYRPRVTLAEGLATTVEWYRRNFSGKRGGVFEDTALRGRPVRA